MKKPNQPAKSPRSARHSKSTSKPVTIDLEAKPVDAKPAKGVQSPTKTSKSSASVPKSSTGSRKPAEPVKRPATDNAETTKQTPSAFGRTSTSVPELALPEGNRREPPQAKPSKSEPSQVGTGRRGAQFVPALLGGIVALCGAGVLQYVGILGIPGASNTAYVSQEALDQRITSLQGQIKEATAPSDANVIDAKIDRKISEFAQSSEGPGLDVVTTQVNETTLRVEKLQSELSDAANSIAELKNAISAGGAGEAAALSTISARLNALAGRLDQLQIDNRETKTEDSSELRTRLTALQANLPKLQQDLSDQIGKLSQKLASTERKLSSLSEISATKTTGDKQAARALAVAALKNDIDRGLPFAASLQALLSMTEQKDGLKGLIDFSESGVPTVEQLTAQFNDIGNVILQTLAPKPKDDLASRLLEGAKSFVKVKSTGPIEGKTPEALISQISDALTNKDLQKAATLWSALPVEGRAVSTQWHENLQSRLTADTLVSKAIQTFILSNTTR